MYLPESFQPLADERGLSFRIRGLTKARRRGVVPEVAAWAGSGLAVATPSGVFLLGNAGPDNAPYVLTFAVACVALGTAIGLMRALGRGATSVAGETDVRLDVQGVAIGSERRGWDQIRGLSLDKGELRITAVDGELRGAAEHLTPDEVDALRGVLEKAWGRWGHRPEDAMAAEDAARRLRERVRQ